MVGAYAATLLKAAGHYVTWDDGIAEEKSYHRWLTDLKKNSPHVILLETKTPVVKKHWKITGDIKEALPDTQVVLVGDHTTALPEESMRESKVDFVLTGGDYDFLLLNLVKFLQGKEKLEPGIWFRENSKIKSTGTFRLEHDLDSLPFIDRDLTKWWLYSENNGNFKDTPGIYTMVGRDCWWRKNGGCTFCSWPTLYPNFRVRRPELLVDEIGHLIENYGVKEVFDDTGTFPVGEWLRKFCRLMIKYGYNREISFDCNMRFGALDLEDYQLMRRAGFRMLLFGLESGSQRILDQLNKGTTVKEIMDSCRKAKQAGLTVHITIMFGYHSASKADELSTYELAKRLMESGNADTLQSTLLIPYPGTQLYRFALENHLLRFSPGDWEKWDMSEPVLESKSMSPDELKQLCDDAYKLFLLPKYVLRRILSIRSVDELKFAFKGVRKVMGHVEDFS